MDDNLSMYADFLQRKAIVDPPSGLVQIPDLHNSLFDFQHDIVRWALRRGRAAVFADCGLGKTFMQLEWARHIPGNVLILAPLAVAAQTVREGERFDIVVRQARSQDDVHSGITITNYEMLDRFNSDYFQGIVLDESSILKAHDGKTRTRIIDAFSKTPFRLACTATPAPNDFMEIGNHAEFLGAMTRSEMLSMFFVHDGGETQKWRLKGHAEADFWNWICSWAVMLRQPSDLGYNNDGRFVLPEMVTHEIIVEIEQTDHGFLFPVEAATLQERLRARRNSISERISDCASLVNATDQQFLIWCNLNDESSSLAHAIPDAIEVTGSDTNDAKEQAMLAFTHGAIRVLISKPSICGFGMNWQHCHNIAFVGLSDSYEQFYQAVRRCWRFGQQHPVNVYLITSQIEGSVVSNIRRKEADAQRMAEEMVKHMQDLNKAALSEALERDKSEYHRGIEVGENWTIHLADCIDVSAEQTDESIHYSIYSPPFSSLYTYSNSDRDMGNCRDDAVFMEHYLFLVKELYRITKPGRLTSFHCMNLPTSKTHHGYIGMRDFRGELIRLHQDAGWIFHSEVCIWKDPVTAMQRTKALGLLHKQLKKDSTMSRQGIPDYLVTMRKPGENTEPVSHTNDTFPVQVWQNYASPIWMDINPSDTLQFRSAREHQDERHIAPLQLQVIERALMLWSNPGDLVFSPFAGIGSEGFQALKMGRRFLGAELKASYWREACRNMHRAEIEQHQLFGHSA